MRNGLGTLSAFRGRSVIPSEVEGSALAEAFQRRNADLERRCRGKGRILSLSLRPLTLWADR